MLECISETGEFRYKIAIGIPGVNQSLTVTILYIKVGRGGSNNDLKYSSIPNRVRHIQVSSRALIDGLVNSLLSPPLAGGDKGEGDVMPCFIVTFHPHPVRSLVLLESYYQVLTLFKTPRLLTGLTLPSPIRERVFQYFLRDHLNYTLLKKQSASQEWDGMGNLAWYPANSSF
jgi:hypothetical protein